jgi:hypothetical protein
MTLIGCHDKNNDPKDGEDVIYVVGTTRALLGMNGTVWKNGKVLKKTDFNAFFRAVYVHDDVVYAVGEKVFSDDDHPFVWRSNDPNNYHRLGDRQSELFGIHGSGNDIYAVDNGGKVWDVISGSLVHDLGNRAVLNGVYVSGTDVYSAGIARGDYTYASVWRGNQPISFEEPFIGMFLGIHGSVDDMHHENIYAVGVCISDEESYPIWLKLGGGSGRLGNGNGIARCVSISGNNVYIAGVDEIRDPNYIETSTQGTARVWKGTTEGTTFTPHLSFGTGKTISTVYAVGDSVYTLVSDEGGYMISRVYKDGKSIHSHAVHEFPMHMFVVEGDKKQAR